MKKLVLIALLCLAGALCAQGQTIYRCEYRNEADLVVYRCKYRNEAGWINNEKKQLMQSKDHEN